MYPEIKTIESLDFNYGLELILRIILDIMTPITCVLLLTRVTMPSLFTLFIDTIRNIKNILNRPGIEFCNLILWVIILLIAFKAIARGLWSLFILLFGQIRVVQFKNGSHDIVSLKEAHRMYNTVMMAHIGMALNDIIDMLNDKEDDEEQEESIDRE